jgi:hypothetical protein
MTITLGLNENNDLFLDDTGNIAIFSALSAAVQNCSTATKAQLGEMIFANDSGMPNFQVVWVGQPNIPQFEAALRSTLSAVPDVTAVLDINTTRTDDILNYTATISTIYGNGVINGNI